jgi:uncharacterized membrane protein (UPF0127 family)
MEFRYALTLRQRLFGLLDRRTCAHGEVLVLYPCNNIHTFGMSEPLDIAFVDRKGIVLKTIRGLKPNRIRGCRRAVLTLERRTRSAGRQAWFKTGLNLRSRLEGLQVLDRLDGEGL